MEAYLDNSATTPVSETVKDLAVHCMTVDFGNPSSRHQKGVDAEKYVRQARERIAAAMRVSEREIFFTSGGTESNNWALIGSALANKRNGKKIITTAIEHPAVIQPSLFLQDLGFEVAFLPVDENGHISLENLKKELTPDTIIVSTMMVNNEMGAVEPVREIAKIVHDYNPAIIYHVDAIQGYGKLRIYPGQWGIDLLSVSGHKLHAPKGTGFLYIREKTKIRPIIYGGGQQKGMRSGTDNVPGIAGLGLASLEAYTDFEEKQAGMLARKKQLMDALSKMEGVTLNSEKVILRDGVDESAFDPHMSGKEALAVIDAERSTVTSAPQIVSASFAGVRAEVLLHALEEKGVYVSSGSACSSNRKSPVSSVLREIHLARELQDSTIRFSFSDWTTPEEIDFAVEALNSLLPLLRRFTRR